MITTLTVKEVAERLRMSTDTVYRWIEDGRIKAAKPGGEYRIPAEEVDRLLTPSDG